jgi:hypothetical protein
MASHGYPYENAILGRVNGILKTDWLAPWASQLL